MSEGDDRLRLDYEETTNLMRTLTDVRFKLLAFIPTLAGAAVAVLGRSGTASDRLAVGALGLAATLGVLVHELRNTQVYDYAVRRAQALESRLGLVSIARSGATGGLHTEGPSRHDGGLALVYGAALAGWSYLVAWGGLHAVGVGNAKEVGGAIGLTVGVLAAVELARVDRGTVKASTPQEVARV